MEQLATNSIAEKLESLDMLPTGYTPNLDSKWALLERSREGEKRVKRKGIFWMRAAALVLLCSFILLFLPDREAALSIVEKSPEKTIEHSSSLSRPKFPKASLKGQDATKHSANKKKISEMQIVEPGVQYEPIEQTALGNDSLAGPQPPGELAVETVATRKKKTRYVQMDFGETDRETKIAPAYCTPTRFKLFNSGRQNHEKESQTNSGTAHLHINL